VRISHAFTTKLNKPLIECLTHAAAAVFRCMPEMRAAPPRRRGIHYFLGCEGAD
jgi:hypothetical protein